MPLQRRILCYIPRTGHYIPRTGYYIPMTGYYISMLYYSLFSILLVVFISSVSLLEKATFFILFNDHLHLVEDFVILGVIFGSRKERRNVVVRFSGVRGYRKGGKMMGGVFIQFRGGAGALTQKSPGWSYIPLLGASYFTRLLYVVGKVIPNVMCVPIVCLSWTG